MKITAIITGEKIESSSSLAFSLYEKSKLGEKVENKIIYTIFETFYLFEQGKLDLYQKDKKLNEKEVLTRLSKIDKNFTIKYAAFKDLRKKGLIPKAALKFGADFRVYENFNSINQQHARWLVVCFSENSRLDWREFASKNRIAHSTNKNLLIALVDSEQAVNYYEVSWKKI